jgi:hypothetical protein
MIERSLSTIAKHMQVLILIIVGKFVNIPQLPLIPRRAKSHQARHGGYLIYPITSHSISQHFFNKEFGSTI